MRKLLRWMLWSLPAVAVVIGGSVTTVAIARQRPRTLPAPTGAFTVGRAMREWTDTTRTDPLAPHPDQPRSLAVWLWYPAASPTGTTAAYAPGKWSSLQQQGFLAGPLDAIRTDTYDGAPPAGGRFPLVVLEPGLGLSAPHLSSLAQELASQGFVVAGVTPTYSANVTVLSGRVVERSPAGNPQDLTDTVAGGLVEVWAADARFAARKVAADPLGEHVDTARIAYVGHSLGGAASLQACRGDPACAGAVDLDGTPYGPVGGSGLAKPFLLLSAQDGCLAGQCRPGAGPDSVAVETAARRLVAASTGRHWRYAIDGAQHFNFTDYAVYFLVPPLHHLLGQLGSIDGRRGLAISDACVLAFLDHVLRSGPAPDRLDARFPELRAYT